MKPTPVQLPNDLPSQAMMLSAMRQARRIPTCAMCANPRRVVETADGAYIVCDRCKDVELVTVNVAVNAIQRG